MIPAQDATLRIPGAQLHYEVRGTGPVLLMIAAGAGDAQSYRLLAQHLVQQFTVVTYDRRGFALSPLDDPQQVIEINTHSEDTSALLSALTIEPAYVFGCSIGALIGLDLVIHHPDQVRTLVAHEPPAGHLLSQAEQAKIRQLGSDLQGMFQHQGTTEAIKKFAASIGVNHPKHPNAGLPQSSDQRAEQNRQSFFKYDTGAVARYVLNVDALKASSTRIIPAGGSEGRDYFPYQCALALAHHLGVPLAEFPGNHAGFVGYPHEFAKTLRNLICDSQDTGSA